MPPPANAQANLQLSQLYHQHHGWLRGWLQRRLGNRCDAADLAQDTFVRLLVSPAALQQPIATPRAYLATIARRLVINLYRRRSLEQAYLEVLASLPEESTPSLEHQALVLEALHEVDAVLARLPDKARQAFLMYQLEGCTQEAIARHLGTSVRSVQRYLALAFEECIVLAAEAL
ncbi:RNA polymerase sigma-70 factor (ECF subfamily) [Pseudomonas nitritireducens]|uniref:RNA polymerase sigma-70 factor (ECF subfamily) n=1 Tax=Pseudomonas nitroreducens TaxID=46680 RepID=A0A7W7KJU0_PSENT|nr:sigma-70 family RNA polymerase sigma factor [Pseudomonas nitritireducens]MBB4864137.1 RNA polymerase sigma-70 factor (ECF subfamily) [Pseudomonas nitritireducens]